VPRGSGGSLEATALTSFVVMSLAAAQVRSSKFKVQGSVAADVIQEGVKVLINSARPDGSSAIDTSLATWNTTLAINALAGAGEDVGILLRVNEESVGTTWDAYMRGSTAIRQEAKRGNFLSWFLSCQHLKRHLFTGANPGGFGWSDLSGAVP